MDTRQTKTTNYTINIQTGCVFFPTLTTGKQRFIPFPSSEMFVIILSFPIEENCSHDDRRRKGNIREVRVWLG